MRSLFQELSDSLQDGIYIFVAKHSIIEATHTQLQKDLKKILSRAKAFQEK